MAKTTDELVSQFKEDMSLVVKKFDEAQHIFFNGQVKPYAPLETYDLFPQHFYEALFSSREDAPKLLED